MKIIKSILLSVPIVATTMLNGQTSSSLLWKIEKPGNKTSFVFLSTNVCMSGSNFKKLESNVLPQIEAIAIEQNLNSEENKKEVQNSIGVTDNNQKLKNILPPNEYQKILIYAKEQARMTEQMVNMFKPFYLNAFLTMSANPCGSTSGYKLEDELQPYSIKKGIPYTELLEVGDYIRLMDAGNKEYWSANISYVFGNSDEARSALETKNKFYSSENGKALKDYYNNNKYFKIKYNQDLVQKYSEMIVPKIEKLTKEKSTLFTVDPGYFIATENSLFVNLKKVGYTITPMTF